MDWSDGIQGLIKKAKAMQKQSQLDEPDMRDEYPQNDEGPEDEDTWYHGIIRSVNPQGSITLMGIEEADGIVRQIPMETRMGMQALESLFGSVDDAIDKDIVYLETDYGSIAAIDSPYNEDPLENVDPYWEEQRGEENLKFDLEGAKDSITKEAQTVDSINALLMAISNIQNMPVPELVEKLDFIKSQLTEKIVTLSKQAQNLSFEPGEIDEMGQGGMWRIYVWNVIWNAVQQAERELIGKLSLTHDEENRSIVIQVFNDLVENLKSAVEAKEIESSDDSMNKEAQEFPQRSRGTSDEYFTLSITLNYDGSIQAENNANMKHREWADEELGDDFHNLVAWIKNELTEGRYQLVASAEGMTKEAQDKELMDFVFSAEDISKTAQTKKQAQTRIPISSLQIPHTVVKALHRKGITFTDQIDANLEVIRETLTEAQMAQLSRGLEGAVSPGREVSLDEDVSADAETNKINETELENEGESIPDGDLGEESLEEDLLEVAASTKKVATQGAYIGSRRPKTKKELKEAIQTNPDDVSLEATSMFGNEYSGSISNAPDGKYYVVGPDPQVSRKWYAQIIVSGGKVTVK